MKFDQTKIVADALGNASHAWDSQFCELCKGPIVISPRKSLNSYRYKIRHECGILTYDGESAIFVRFSDVPLELTVGLSYDQISILRDDLLYRDIKLMRETILNDSKKGVRNV